MALMRKKNGINANAWAAQLPKTKHFFPYPLSSLSLSLNCIQLTFLLLRQNRVDDSALAGKYLLVLVYAFL